MTLTFLTFGLLVQSLSFSGQTHSPWLLCAEIMVGMAQTAEPELDANFALGQTLFHWKPNSFVAASPNGKFVVRQFIYAYRGASAVRYVVQQIGNKERVLASFDFPDIRESRMQFQFLSNYFLAVNFGSIPPKARPDAPTGTRIYDLNKSTDKLVMAAGLFNANEESVWYDSGLAIQSPQLSDPRLQRAHLKGSSRDGRFHGWIDGVKLDHETFSPAVFYFDANKNSQPLVRTILHYTLPNGGSLYDGTYFEISGDGLNILVSMPRGSSQDFLLFDLATGAFKGKIISQKRRFGHQWNPKMVRRLFSANGKWIAIDGRVLSSSDLSPANILLPYANDEDPFVASWFDGNDLVLLTPSRAMLLGMIRGPDRVLRHLHEIYTR